LCLNAQTKNTRWRTARLETAGQSATVIYTHTAEYSAKNSLYAKKLKQMMAITNKMINFARRNKKEKTPS
jgi:uncharacterized FlgJ-related protein